MGSVSKPPSTCDKYKFCLEVTNFGIDHTYPKGVAEIMLERNQRSLKAQLLQTISEGPHAQAQKLCGALFGSPGDLKGLDEIALFDL
jgi:hypothetical protein